MTGTGAGKENRGVDVTRPRLALSSFARCRARRRGAVGARLFFTNGQTGTTPDGITPESTEEQALVAFERLRTILQAADMTFGNIVRLNTYLINENDIEVFLDVRDRILGDHEPASTFFLIKALARPELKIEIEAVAAKVDHVLASSLSQVGL